MSKEKEAEPMENEKSDSIGMSRRQFLKDAGLVVGGATIGSMTMLNACNGGGEAKTVTQTVTVTTTKTTEIPGTAANKLTVNGITHELTLQPHWTLAWVIREKLALTGTKVSCDLGACGLCTVLMDNEPVLACLLLAIECQGKNIVTIEGLEKDGVLDPIQESFIKNDAMQCGYCIPGAVMMAKALLIKTPKPNKEQITKALAGVLCRCGTYTRQVQAVMEVV